MYEACLKFLFPFLPRILRSFTLEMPNIIVTLRSLLPPLMLLVPSLLLAQEPAIPDKVRERFHPEEGLPWFMKDGRPDSLDILRYEVDIHGIDRDAGTFEGNCRIRARVLKEGITGFPFDLAGFEVQRVRLGGRSIAFERKGQKLWLDSDTPLPKGDTVEFQIAYAGEPVIDETGWGGTYFRNGYVFNLGVGFGAKPHSYGRTWFPCVDHYQERASYRFRVTAPEGEKAVCSGSLEELKDVEKGKEWHWELEQQVPPYLVSFAVGPFTTIKKSYEKQTGEEIPVRLDVAPEDSANAIRSFGHLKEAIRLYEDRYGPYRWPRVGYVAVPFPSGAMEHATNIAYPSAAVNGTHRSDDLMVHELSHSWWGNLVTCATPWDMWINEGMASFSEFLFRERMDGDEGYLDAVKKNHKKVLRSAHLQDGNEHRAVYGIPHQYTYGAHVYDKGADLVRTFRYMIGDSLFFGPLKRILSEHPLENMYTQQLGKLWQRYSGRPMEAYFKEWLMRPGFPHFRVQAFDADPKGGSYRVKVELKQRMTHASEPYRMVPVELLFHGSNGSEQVEKVRISEKKKAVSFEMPFEPVHVAADPGGRLAQATITDTITIGPNTISRGGVHDLDHVDAKIDLDSVEERFYVHLRQHFIEADIGAGMREQYRVSKTRFWSVRGSYTRGRNMRVVFEVDGRAKKGVHPEALFFARSEKDIDETELLLLHRPEGKEKWQRCENCRVMDRGDPSDGKARILLIGGMKGDFALAAPK